MSEDLNQILDHLRRRLRRGADRLRPPHLYLDPGGVRHLYAELCGVSEPPTVQLIPDPSTGRVELDLDPAGTGPSSPWSLVYEAMAPLIERKTPLIDQPEPLEAPGWRFARIEGELRNTRFPDGKLNLEIDFAGLRGLLFYQPDFFSSLVQPLTADDRFQFFDTPVKALVFLQGPVQTTIFYHQTYGDNTEYRWLPVTPVVMTADGKDDSAP